MQVGGELAEAVEDAEDTEDLSKSPAAIFVSQIRHPEQGTNPPDKEP